MAQIIQLGHFSSEKGELTVIENILPDGIKRVYYISGVPANTVRGGHRHHKTWQVLVTLRGSCRIFTDNGTTKQYFNLDNPDTALLLEPQDWHTMDTFSNDALLLVLANEVYDIDDYIDEPYG